MMHDDDGNVYDWTTRMYTIGLGVMLKGLIYMPVWICKNNIHLCVSYDVARVCNS